MSVNKLKTKATKNVKLVVDTSALSPKQIENHERDIALLTNEQIVALNATSVVSHRIRYLLSEKFARATVANILGKRYQHVRNVEITPIKKAT